MSRQGGINRQAAKSAKGETVEPDEELDRLARCSIGAAIEVHRVLGPGLLESVYEQALCVELALAGIAFARQVPVSVEYKNHRIGEMKMDLLIGGKLIVELKTIDSIAPVHIAQLLSYLKITRLRLGLLINFNVAELRSGIKRLVHSR